MKTYHYNNKNFIKLYNADCLELMDHLVRKGIQVGAIITDPPYGYLDHKLDRRFDNNKFFKLAYKLIKKDGFLIFFGRGVENAKRMVIADEVGFKFKEEMIWNKIISNTFTLNLHRIHEMVYIFTKGNGTINKVYKPATDEIFICDKDEYKKVLEVKLMEVLIELVDDGSNDFTVLDPFAGSCATGVACYNLDKNFIGCEIDNEYFNAAVNRIYRECPQKLL